MSKFKVGDRVIGNAKANTKYLVTRKGYGGVVIDVVGNLITIKGIGGEFSGLDEDHFDLVDATPTAAKPAPRHILTYTHDGDTMVEEFQSHIGINQRLQELLKERDFDRDGVMVYDVEAAHAISFKTTIFFGEKAVYKDREKVELPQQPPKKRRGKYADETPEERKLRLRLYQRQWLRRKKAERALIEDNPF
jgi:hypothetical protein